MRPMQVRTARDFVAWLTTIFLWFGGFFLLVGAFAARRPTIGLMAIGAVMIACGVLVYSVGVRLTSGTERRCVRCGRMFRPIRSYHRLCSSCYWKRGT
jgi:hypothetical protein